MKKELTYHTCRDYLIPDIKLSFDTHVPLDKFRRLQRQYLQENTPMLYKDLMQSNNTNINNTEPSLSER